MSPFKCISKIVTYKIKNIIEKLKKNNENVFIKNWPYLTIFRYLSKKRT
jgi:hypothetical protein